MTLLRGNSFYHHRWATRDDGRRPIRIRRYVHTGEEEKKPRGSENAAEKTASKCVCIHLPDSLKLMHSRAREPNRSNAS